MGNTSGKRESRESGALSPTKEIPPNTFDFKPGKTRILQHGSLDDSLDLQSGIMKVSVQVHWICLESTLFCELTQIN